MSESTPDQASGQDGELLNRLELALRAYGESSDDGFYTAKLELVGVLEIDVPWEVNAPEVVIPALIQRLRQGIEAGIPEDWVVREARDSVTRAVRTHVANADQMGRNRTEYREAIERILADPAAIERVREEMQQKNPDKLITSEKVQGDLSEMRDKPFRDLDIEKVAEWWSMESAWQALVEQYLSDADFEEWGARKRS